MTGVRRRARVALAAALAMVAATAGVVSAAKPSVGSPNETVNIQATGQIAQLDQFPVQGLCGFVNSYGAPRSGGRTHEGVDIIAKVGKYVYAVRDGVLTKKYVDKPGALAGNGWRLTAADGTYFFYAHLSAFGDSLSVGSHVVAGQIIGFVGKSGSAGTPHLHFEVHPGGGPAIDPTPSVKAIDGCKNINPPPAAVVPVPPASGNETSTTTVATTTAAPPTIAPTTTVATTTPAPTTTPVAPVVAPATSVGSGRWQFIDPVVVLAAVPASVIRPDVATAVKVAGLNGISKNTKAVLVRVSATAGQPANVIVHPCGIATPFATTLFVEPGTMAIGTAPVNLSNGQLCVTSSAAASVKVTVVAKLAATGVGGSPLATNRVLDTRTTARLVAQQLITIPPASLGASNGLKAITATFTVLNPSSGGTLTITPCGSTEMKAPFTVADVTSFSTLIRVSAAGLCVSSTVATDLVIDVGGLWNADGPAMSPLTPLRVFDSRGTRTTVGSSPVTVEIGGAVAGLQGAVTVVQANLTLIGGDGSASVFIWPCSQPQPAASVGVVRAGQIATFSVLASVADGALCVASNAPVEIVVDLVGAG